MTDVDEKYKLGELTADMAAVKRDIVDIKAGQKEILHRLDNLSVVSVERWEKRNAHVDKTFAAHNVRIESLEDSITAWRNSTANKILVFLDKTAVQIIGTAIFGLLVVSIFYYVQKLSEYGEVMREFQSKVQQ